MKIENCKMKIVNCSVGTLLKETTGIQFAIFILQFAIFNAFPDLSMHFLTSQRSFAAFLGPNSNHVIHGENEDFAISKFAGAG